MHGQKVHIHAFKWRLKRTHFVKHDTQRPDVGLERVWLPFNDLWRQIVRSADHRPWNFLCMAQNSCNSEVSEFDEALLRQENILAFYVSVQNFAVMHVLHSKTNLSEPVKDLSFWKHATTLLFYLLAQVASISVVHDDTQLSSLGFKSFNKLDNVCVAQMFNDLCFLESLFLLWFRHPCNVDDFHNTI